MHGNAASGNIFFSSRHTGKAVLVLRIHGYLSRYGFINFGIFKQQNPLLGELVLQVITWLLRT